MKYSTHSTLSLDTHLICPEMLEQVCTIIGMAIHRPGRIAAPEAHLTGLGISKTSVKRYMTTPSRIT